jgi:hypothetical protein
MTLTPDQLKRINARAERQKYKDSGGETGKLSLFIRIGMSTLYDWEPAVRAVLKEIAFMTVQGEGDLMKPSAECRKDIPYDGWCWASEKTLAMRVGCSERWVREALRRFGKDTIMHFRQWRDKFGRPHNEYHILEATVDAAQRDTSQPRPKCKPKVRKPNGGTFSKTHQPLKTTSTQGVEDASTTHRVRKDVKAIGSSARKPQELQPVPHRNSSPSAVGTLVRQPQEVAAVEGVDVGVGVGGKGVRRTSTYPASRGSQSFASLSNPKPQKQQQPQPVTLPEPLPLTPDETCAECGGFYLDCNHKSGTLASPLVAALPKKDSGVNDDALVLPTRQAFEIEEDL